MMKRNTLKLVVGIGSALVDILVRTDDAFLETCGASKGGMELVDLPFIEKNAGTFR
ncbi:hypothetical protein ACFLZL_03995 [Thermodesulfobacteriota bacterium]